MKRLKVGQKYLARSLTWVPTTSSFHDGVRYTRTYSSPILTCFSSVGTTCLKETTGGPLSTDFITWWRRFGSRALECKYNCRSGVSVPRRHWLCKRHFKGQLSRTWSLGMPTKGMYVQWFMRTGIILWRAFEIIADTGSLCDFLRIIRWHNTNGYVLISHHSPKFVFFIPSVKGQLFRFSIQLDRNFGNIFISTTQL